MVTNFHELYQKYSQDVYRFAYWVCGNSQDAEDITAETFVRALTSSAEIRSETVKGYLLTIAKNLAYKKSRREKRLISLDEENIESDSRPAQQAEDSASVRTAMRFIQTLPDADRMALILRIGHNLPYEEIAAMLNISLTAAKVKVHRARIKLTEYVQEQEEPQP
ncbi:MAG: RNA polymerase sigma factor [Anaerolineae bacterium]|nr:RNA polymerase sigma factor [Anaerolineae bacterium]MBL8105806.1 RNA polymerase sigma factor [Anaerolineales bacterium]MCC7190322.1 RNA polymerase sigma factor [Anaerolineales bacterium]